MFLWSHYTLVPVGCSSGDAAVHHERWNPGGHVGLGQGSQPISKHGGWWHHQQVILSSQTKIAPFVWILQFTLLTLISRPLDAVPVFRTSLRWEITLKPWSSSIRPRFQNETSRPQQNWAGCRQNRLYWTKTWWELKWRHQSWEEDMRADQCKWSEILQNDTEWRTFNNVLMSFLLKYKGPITLS